MPQGDELKATKEKEQKLQAELDASKRMVHAKSQQIAGLQHQLRENQNTILALRDHLKLQPGGLEILQKKSMYSYLILIDHYT